MNLVKNVREATSKYTAKGSYARYLLFLCLELLNLHMLKDCPMDRSEPRLWQQRWRGAAREPTFCGAATRGHSPTSRHHPFNVTATLDAFPIMDWFFFDAGIVPPSPPPRHWLFIALLGILNRLRWKFLRFFRCVKPGVAVLGRLRNPGERRLPCYACLRER